MGFGLYTCCIHVADSWSVFIAHDEKEVPWICLWSSSRLPQQPSGCGVLKLVLYCHRGHIQFCTFYLQSLELRGQCYHEAPHENTVELVVLCSQETWELAAQLRVWWLASYLKAKATSWMWAQLLSTFQKKEGEKAISQEFILRPCGWRRFREASPTLPW